MSINDHFIEGSESFDEGFIDTGTTFTYFPPSLFQKIKSHFEWFCKA